MCYCSVYSIISHHYMNLQIMNKLRILEIILLGLLLTNCGTSGSSNNSSTTEEAVELPKFSIHDEEIHDVPIKTQVTLHVIIEEDEINEGMIRNLLNDLYSKTMKRTGFDHRTSPSSAYIYAYTSKEKAQSGMGQWIGMLSKSHVDTQSSISISEVQMNALNETEEIKWELSFEQRQNLWIEIIKSEDQAQKEAEKKYPLDNPNLTMDDMNKSSNYSDQLKDKLAKELAKKHGIALATLDSVSLEGHVNGWAFPDY